MFSQNYSQEVSLSTQQEHGGKKSNQQTQDMVNHNLSNTIESICEENHQLGGMVTASLENLDKYREKLREDLTKINLQLKENDDIHNEQKIKLINLQMENENFGCQYQQEIEQRKELVDKMNVIHEVTSLLFHHHNIMLNNLQKFQNDHKTVKNSISELLSYLKQLQAKSIKDNSDFQTQGNVLMTNISTLEDENMKYRQEMTNKIDDKRTKLMELSERKLQLDQRLNIEMQKRSQLSQHYKNISFKHDAAKKNISGLKQNLKEVQKKSEEIPKLNLMINTANNELTNITNAHESTEKYLTELKIKMKQAGAKIKQLESSIVESRQQEDNNKEQILSLTEKMSKLKSKEEEVQNELKRRKNVQLSEIIRLKKILDGKKSDKDKITSTIDQNRKINVEVNNNLITLKKEVEANTGLNNNLQKDNDNLQIKTAQLEFSLYEVKQGCETKQQTIDATLNDQKDKVIQKTHENNNLTTRHENLKHECTNLCREKKMLDKIYNTKNAELKSIIFKSKELQKTLEENIKIYTLTKQDEEDKLNDLENQLVDNLGVLQDFPYLRDNKAQIEDSIKERDNIWIAENNEEIHKFSLQMQDLEREKALYQANIDAISHQEEETLSKTKKLISHKNQLALKLEYKLQHSNLEMVKINKKEAEYKNNIARLEGKLRHVSNTAKITRQEIKAAFAPNKEDKEYKPTSIKPNRPQPPKRASTLQDKIKDPFDFESD